jgi:DNA-binding transcriptional regulator YhcF (GntR family)
VLRHLDPCSSVPRYAQIADAVRLAVATGRLPAGAALPSVRRMAAQLGVNPATVAQAYRRLRGEGVVETRRGTGSFVRRLAAPRSARARRREAASLVERLLREARARGLAPAEIERAVRDATAGRRR